MWKGPSYEWPCVQSERLLISRILWADDTIYLTNGRLINGRFCLQCLHCRFGSGDIRPSTVFSEHFPGSEWPYYLAGMFGCRSAGRLSMLFDWYNWCRLILFGWCSDDTVGAIRRIERMLECRWTSFVGLVSFDLCRWTNAFKRRALNECLWTMTVRWKRPMPENVTHMMWVRPFDEIRLEFQCRRAKETWHSDDSRRPGILKFRIQSLDSKRNSLQVFHLQEFLLAIFTHSKNDEAEHASHSIDATRLRISFENAKWLTRTNDNVLNGRDSGIFKITNCVCCCEGLALRCWRCIRCCRFDAHYAFGIWSSDVFFAISSAVGKMKNLAMCQCSIEELNVHSIGPQLSIRSRFDLDEVGWLVPLTISFDFLAFPEWMSCLLDLAFISKKAFKWKFHSSFKSPRWIGPLICRQMLNRYFFSNSVAVYGHLAFFRRSFRSSLDSLPIRTASNDFHLQSTKSFDTSRWCISLEMF